MNEAALIHLLKKNRSTFHPVVPFNAAAEKIISFDFTEKNKNLTDAIVKDTNKFSDYINRLLESNKAKFGIGGYNEHRTVYSRSKLFGSSEAHSATAATAEDEPRRLHLGIDIWRQSGTAVMAPLDGIVHSYAFNNNFGDYGATIILTHQVEEITFHILYGHLSLNSLKNLQQGLHINKGDVFAEFGMIFENGHWPPHLHCQLILDMQGMQGDYPGVCRYSEKEKYLANCPDPDFFLQLNQYAVGSAFLY
jgi:peptidoglycan LD-endopeptidase LytH